MRATFPKVQEEYFRRYVIALLILVPAYMLVYRSQKYCPEFLEYPLTASNLIVFVEVAQPTPCYPSRNYKVIEGVRE